MSAVLVVDLGLDATNEDIRDQMRVMKKAREERAYAHVVCVVRGFDGDARALWDIPEVRAFCRRLMTLGFPSYLDTSTQLDRAAGPEVRAAWGPMEGRLSHTLLIDQAFRVALDQKTLEVNAIADAALGVMA